MLLLLDRHYTLGKAAQSEHHFVHFGKRKTPGPIQPSWNY